MYKVTLNGNYNIYVKDLNFEFTPIKTVKTFSDEEFENSTDIKVFLGEYLTATKVGNEKQAKKVAEKKVSSDVKEVPVKTKNVEEEKRDDTAPLKLELEELKKKVIDIGTQMIGLIDEIDKIEKRL